MSKNVREAAFVSLMRIDGGNKYSNIEIDSALNRWNIDEVDRPLFCALVYGVIERRITLDWLISRFSSTPPEKLDPDVLCVLRLAFYQIRFLDRIPDHAACFESVELCKKRCRRGKASAPFVNAVVRSFLRGMNNVELPDKSSPLGYSVEYGLPEWLCRMWLEAYPASAEDIMAASCSHPTLTLRANTKRITRGELKATLDSAMYLCRFAENTDAAPYALILERSVSYPELERRFGELFYVEDSASQLAMERFVDGVWDSDSILDACAAPGGKSMYLALSRPDCEITACDLHENKLSLIRKTAERLGIDNISTQTSDGTVYRGDFDRRFDHVLCDAPCSGLGVIAKKPDLRFKKEEDIARLPIIQYSILSNCSRYVKPGGSLMYSTCTLNPAENEAVTDKFSAESDFELTERETIFPDRERDGFFYAIFRRPNQF